MIRFVIFIFIICSSFANAQNVVKGNVNDVLGRPIPGVRVSVLNTTYGVPTDFNGNYFLEITALDSVVLKFTMIGMEVRIDTLVITSKIHEHNITLLENARSLSSVEIYADKRDIAKEVIQNAMEMKDKYRYQYESYKCQTYIKSSLESENRYNRVTDSLDADGELVLDLDRTKMNFIESVSESNFYQKDKYHEVILAYQDYSDKSSSTTGVSASFSRSGDIAPTQNIKHNPYLFFEKLEDGDINLYQNLLTLPKIAENPIVSPLAINAFINYKFILNSVFFQDGQKIFDIAVEPRFSETALFSGNIYIIDSLWVIKSFDLSINKNAMNYFKSFRINQDYKLLEDKWVVTRREFDYTVNDFNKIVIGNTRVNHKDYQFNIEELVKSDRNILMKYDEEAFDKDSLYWSETRPIQLKEMELDFIAEQDSIYKEITSDKYIDSVNNEFNRIKFWDIVLNGVGFRSRIKRQEIFINPLIGQIIPLGMGGFRWKLGGSYSKEFENAQAFSVDGFIDYGFRNEDVKGQLGVEYTFLPKRFGSFKIAGGDIYDFVTMEQSIEDFFSVSNQVRKTFIELSQRIELTNGLYGKISFDHSVRRDVSNVEFAPWVDTLVNLGIWSYPDPYETYTVSIIGLEFLYRFKQKYILKGNKKLIVGTEYPELKLRYKIGVPNLFGSDVNFSFLQIDLSDKVKLGTFGELKWRMEAGSFLGSNKEEVQYVERKFIRGSDLFFFSNPLNTMQLLDSTFNTTSPFFQAYGIHHFNGAIMDKIWLINKLKLQIVAGAGALFLQDKNYAHVEFYGGLERVFKIRQQLFKASVFYVVRDNNADSINFNFKIGFDFFNTFSNEWSY